MPSNPIIVQKYGGVCLETPARIRAAASSVADLHGRGHRVVAIVSAMGKTTDELVRMAYQVSPHPNRRELDMLLTTGERISMSLMSMALSDLGVPAISFTGSQAGVMTDGSHSSARILDVRPIRVREELDRGRIVVFGGLSGREPADQGNHDAWPRWQRYHRGRHGCGAQGGVLRDHQGGRRSLLG
ncbi:amino acid kinase family protein [Bradyrhizobium sp. BR 1433]|uniref:amino acid kinase family protein n=1 Tax=Bradyrhizobium sp. BR 1433 TaxID=3447967 RepID=UPI003EE56E7D